MSQENGKQLQKKANKIKSKETVTKALKKDINNYYN